MVLKAICTLPTSSRAALRDSLVGNVHDLYGRFALEELAIRCKPDPMPVEPKLISPGCARA